MFGCISKNFPVKYFLVFGKEEGKHKPKKNIINDRDLAINGASSRRRDLAIELRSRSRDSACRSRSEARARDGTRSRSQIEIAPPGARTGDRRRLEIDWLFGFFSSLARARSPSLSLSFSGNALKWKWEEKIISGSKVKILVNRKSFSGKYHFLWQPNMRKRVKMISWNHFHPKQTQPKMH